MTTPTASARGRSNRSKGAETERAVARYLRGAGFDHAERAERNGWRSTTHTSPDPGDLLGTPGLVWSIKNDASNRITTWLDDAEQLRAQHRAELAILVVRRRGKANPSRWWVWIHLASLVHAVHDTGGPVEALSGYVCLELGDAVPMLHAAGYGHAETNSAPNEGGQW